MYKHIGYGDINIYIYSVNHKNVERNSIFENFVTQRGREETFYDQI